MKVQKTGWKTPKYIQRLQSGAKPFLHKIIDFLRSRPYLTACLAIALYLLLFQRHFVFSGDAWAESYAEYLDESIRLGWSEVLAQNWAGYFTIVPSFIAKLYVALNGPLGYADYFFRAVVIVFTVTSAALIAASSNRTIIQHDGLRVVLAVAVVASLSDIASFSFINVWYVGLIPVVIYCLNPMRLSQKADISMGIYGALIALTKPFIVLLPLVIYRLVRTRQYLGAGILLAATAVQSYQILFNDKRQIVESSNFDPQVALGAMITGSSTALLKLVHIVPGSYFVLAIACLVLGTLLFIVWRARGFWITAGIGLVFVFSVYTYALSPDLPAYSGIRHFHEMATFHLKTQREILINAALLLGLFIVADYTLRRYRVIRLPNKFRLESNILIASLSLLLLFAIHQPIDTTSAGVTSSPLQPFRQQLNSDKPTCAPLAPSVFFYKKAVWSFAHRGTCETLTHDLNLFKPDFRAMDRPLDGQQFSYDAKYFRLNTSHLQAIVIPAVDYTANRNALVTITETTTGKSFKAHTSRQRKTEVQLLTFNVNGLPKQAEYNFTVSAKPDLKGGTFYPGDTLVTYPYFLKGHDNTTKP